MTLRISRALGGYLLATVWAAPAIIRAQPPGAPNASPARVFREHSGTLSAGEGLLLNLVTETGNVRIRTSRDLPPGQVRYFVRIEADAGQPEAQQLVKQFVVAAKSVPEGVRITGALPSRRSRGRLAVSYDVSLPQRFNLEIQTGAGNIFVEDLDGRATLTSAGGNLTAGRVGGPARLETDGGHITVNDVAGNLHARTAGGHVSVGTVQGDAVVRSLGGHIRLASVRGTAQLDTAGGNISVQRVGAGVTATTAGGRIDVGEATGAIRAKTAGGGIRVLSLAGPTQLETSGGSIYLTSVQGRVHATTLAGGITAWLAPGGKLQGASQFESGSGDILVYIPRDLPLTIEATVESDGDHRIDAEKGLPLRIVPPGPGPRPRTIRGDAALNGGGETLRLKAQAGNIRLKFRDAYQSYYEKVYESQLKFFEKSREWAKRLLDEQLSGQPEMVQRLKEEQQDREEAEGRPSRVDSWRLRLQERFSGRIPVDADSQRQRLIHHVRPHYPELARRNGIEGIVWLELMIDKSGKVEEANRISGHPLLAQAAIEAVRQWRYKPAYLGEEPVAVASVVRLEFRLD